MGQPAAAERHLALADDRVGQRLGVIRPKRLKSRAAAVIG